MKSLQLQTAMDIKLPKIHLFTLMKATFWGWAIITIISATFYPVPDVVDWVMWQAINLFRLMAFVVLVYNIGAEISKPPPET